MSPFPPPGTPPADAVKGSAGRTLARMFLLSIGVTAAVAAVATGLLAALAAAVWLLL